MDQIKTGKFIAKCRKDKGLTQMQLAEKLNITDRAVSKWENGKGTPDSSIMIDLCNELNISVNELLLGEKINMEDYKRKSEELLLELKQEQEENAKKLLELEKVIGYLSSISFLILIFVGSFAVQNGIWQIVSIVSAIIILLVGVFFALQIEAKAGFYECQKCHNKYVPTYLNVLFAPHFSTTRFMKCPKCGKRSWQKKVKI